MTEAWVTLATNDTYALGALVLGQSLARSGTTRQTHCMVTTGVTPGMRTHLESIYNHVTTVNVMDSEDAENLAIIQRPELGITFTKLNCWKLEQYTKCVFMDADTLVLSNADELFDHEELSAAPDIGWPDMFNSGLFVFKPNHDTYHALLECAITHGSFDGGDQGLLNTYFSDWRSKDVAFRLSFIYNMSSSVVYTYAAAYNKFGKDVKIVHFLGAVKPWHHSWTPQFGLRYRGESTHFEAHVQAWWSVFAQDIQPILDTQYLTVLIRGWAESQTPPTPVNDAAIEGLVQIIQSQGVSSASGALAAAMGGDERQHQRAWEAGHVDYLGRDSWENIQKKIDESMGK